MSKLKRKQQTAADLLYMSQTAVRSAHGSRTGKLHAALRKLGIKRIVLGNVDRHTFTVTKVILSQKLAVIRATRNCRSVRWNAIKDMYKDGRRVIKLSNFYLLPDLDSIVSIMSSNTENLVNQMVNLVLKELNIIICVRSINCPYCMTKVVSESLGTSMSRITDSDSKRGLFQFK